MADGNRTVKVLIVIVLFGGVTVVGFVIGIRHWATQSGREFEESKDERAAKAKEYALDGARGCIDGPLPEVVACGEDASFNPMTNMKCLMNHQFIAFECFDIVEEASGPDASICVGTPEATDILGSVSWPKKECERLGYDGDDMCAAFIQNTQVMICGRSNWRGTTE